MRLTRGFWGPPHNHEKSPDSTQTTNFIYLCTRFTPLLSRKMRAGGASGVRSKYGRRVHAALARSSDTRFVMSNGAKRSRDIWRRTGNVFRSRPDCPSGLCASLRVSTPARSTPLRASSSASGPPRACLRQKRQSSRRNRNPPPNVDHTRASGDDRRETRNEGEGRTPACSAIFSRRIEEFLLAIFLTRGRIAVLRWGNIPTGIGKTAPIMVEDITPPL